MDSEGRGGGGGAEAASAAWMGERAGRGTETVCNQRWGSGGAGALE